MKRVVVLLALTASLGLTACGGDESREDADDVPNGAVEKSEPNVTAFNNKFPNVEHKCLYSRGEQNIKGGTPDNIGEGVGLRVIVTTSKRLIVIPDPHCPGYLPEQANTEAVGGNQP